MTDDDDASRAADYLRLLARAHASSGDARWPDAAELWREIVDRNPVNGDNWGMLAQARWASQDYAGALAAYEQTQRLGVRVHLRSEEVPAGTMPHLMPGDVAYCIACCRARLGATEAAIDALATAVQRGYRDLDSAREDETWASFLGNQRVRELLGIIETEDLSRDDGWRADLRLLAREIKRRAYAPFGVISEAEFDRRIAELDAQIPARTDMQIIVGMMRLVRQLNDGHAFVGWPAGSEELGRALPVAFYEFTEGLFVVAAAAECRELLGARVLRIDGHPVAEVMTAVGEIRSRDNEQQVRFAVPFLLRRPPVLHALDLADQPGAVVLTVSHDGGSAQQVRLAVGPVEEDAIHRYPAGWITLPDALDTPVPLHLRNIEQPFWFDYLPGPDLVYFQFNAVRDHPMESLAEFTDRLFRFIEAKRPARLVIDLRWNGGGNTILGQPLLRRLAGCAQNRRGSLFVIIGRLTFSAAQNIATSIERDTEAIFVGEPTGSAPSFIGETIPFELPYSKVRVNVADLYWQTGWPMDYRCWIPPEIYVPPTFAAFSQNRDPAMDAIAGCHEGLPG